MRKLLFYIVDVFAEKKYAGNQLAVFRFADMLTDSEMQDIAREMNFSETTFILDENHDKKNFKVRIFTPLEEVPFAGHPTLGTTHIIRQEILKEQVDSITLDLKVGQIPVSFDTNENNETVYWMKQNHPIFGNIINKEIISVILNLDLAEIDERFLVEEVSTGLPHIIVPLKSIESLKRIRINKEKYFDLIQSTWAKPLLIFSPEVHEEKNDISVRMFADCFGIAEDPATGSGNGCLAGYLVKHKYFGNEKIDLRSEQGYEINRPSLLYLKAEKSIEKIDIVVGGKVVNIACGEFY
jgi:trans-2,3-dihydro-3-hydroxyanthranilate isomerase